MRAVCASPFARPRSRSGYRSRVVEEQAGAPDAAFEGVAKAGPVADVGRTRRGVPRGDEAVPAPRARGPTGPKPRLTSRHCETPLRSAVGRSHPGPPLPSLTRIASLPANRRVARDDDAGFVSHVTDELLLRNPFVFASFQAVF